MFCLFRNSRILSPWHIGVLLVSLSGVVYWLHFAFIQKAFWQTVLSGQALFVDLLLGLPVVLIFAVVIYAMIYWVLKLLLIFLWPQAIEMLPDSAEQLSDDMPESLHQAWQKEPPSSRGDSNESDKKD
ncbi:hypothetical protein [Thiomicrospira sp. WB1]|uniref:hypothetical protein n=1 Tax=Thiomicrospira sp. WB1 TaxID=1685380 RepID=UPI00074A4B87|nr:hypothetical protein [Thiomicrospira sp. WB1]KUJ72142.1 hypothetical protein AVO41_06870 [Thiomicrospira sp. WB1]